MDWLLSIGVFVLIWWLVFFTVLPWGVRKLPERTLPQEEGAAPDKPRLVLRLWVTTLVALVLWGALNVAVFYWGWEALGNLFPRLY